MLTPAQFTSRWRSDVIAKDPLPEDSELVTAPPDKAASTRLSVAAREFLVQAGLPKSCAPCLCFEEVGKGLPRIWELYSPTAWKPEEKAPLELYLMLGSDGGGSPICVDERDGKVVLVDHELLFEPKLIAARIEFINSSIPHLAESLLLIHTLPVQARHDALLQADPPALAKGAFWSYQSNVQAGADDASVATIEKRRWWKIW